MENQMFRWMDTASGMAKTAKWSNASNGATPREAWYYGPRLGRTELTPDFLEVLRQTFWSGVEAKLDETLTINGVPLLRVTLPKKFVPHFVSDDTTFYLYKAISALVVVDFGQVWGGPVAEKIRRASPMTMMGDVRSNVALDDTPAPRGVLRAEQQRAEANRLDPITTEVEVIPERSPPRIAARLRGDDGTRKPQVHYAVRPSNPTCVPEADVSPDASNPRAITSALKLFEANETDGDDVAVVRPVQPKPTAPTTEFDDPFAAPDAPSVNYGRVAAISSVASVALLWICYAAWVFLSSS